ncbi:uncharacterized protein F4812DRAFT_449719 [Daldinia caldariorum]|uniref:uncharacterized protein n=1 Tax=Daldinia caldariorum TaxID=326644 RepID=UPI002008BBB3|nr:uncharacterized protein F4812DRAFT_449719 [Daldinia caldariorum]KAI1471840.1 hypothetical protein F4812DRAFT_449719 [Daldinia caldariorum]
MSWHDFPAEIRLTVLEILLQDGCSLAGYATVSQEWQTIIERHNFARIKLTPSRLADFGPVTHHMEGMNMEDSILISKALEDLFSTLSQCDPEGNLLLDISVHSSSDSEHWFKYLTFGPDILSDECGLNRREELPMLLKSDDQRHGWIAGSRASAPIMGEGPFDDDELEFQWLDQLPLIPSITGVLLRQQTRRRWKPKSLLHMFGRFPRLREIYYEPWREWGDAFRSLFESLTSNKLQKLIIFENFNQGYSSVMQCKPIRKPNSQISQTIAIASLRLEYLSASFMADASHFFHACQPSWEWPNLTSLALTSQLLTPDGSPSEVANMLQAAAAAAMKMPRLEIMEIWNGREGLAMLFRYQSPRGRASVITWRGTLEIVLPPPAIRAWQSCHGDSIHHLKLSNQVIRPVSLRQLRMEQSICKGLCKGVLN